MSLTDPPADPAMETPLSPLPGADASASPRRKRRRAKQDAAAEGSGVGLLPSFRAGLGYTLSSWKILIVVLAFHLALAATVAIPLQSRMSARLDHHAHGPALEGNPDTYDARIDMWKDGGLEASVWNDAKRLEQPLLDTQRITLYWIVLIAWLFGAVVSGGHLGSFVAGESPTVGAFFVHGAKWFWRMLRVGLVFGLIYYVVGRIVLEVWAGVVAEDERWATSSEVQHRGEQIRLGVMVLTILWLRVACDLGRADLVVYGRSSALGAVVRGFGRTFRHPLRTFGLALFTGVPMIALVFGISFGVHAFSTGSWTDLTLSFVLVEIAVLLRLASRAALLAGDSHLIMAGVRAR